FIAGTGARVGEALGLGWTGLDLCGLRYQSSLLGGRATDQPRLVLDLRPFGAAWRNPSSSRCRYSTSTMRLGRTHWGGVLGSSRNDLVNDLAEPGPQKTGTSSGESPSVPQESSHEFPRDRPVP